MVRPMKKAMKIAMKAMKKKAAAANAKDDPDSDYWKAMLAAVDKPKGILKNGSKAAPKKGLGVRFAKGVKKDDGGKKMIAASQREAMNKLIREQKLAMAIIDKKTGGSKDAINAGDGDGILIPPAGLLFVDIFSPV